MACGIRPATNGAGLRENTATTRERANLILNKGGDHRVVEIRLREL